MKNTFEYIGILILIIILFTINISPTAILVIAATLGLLELMAISRKLSSILNKLEIFQPQDFDEENLI